MIKPKKVKTKLGDVIKIKLEDGSSCYGRILKNPIMAFYDLNETHGVDPDIGSIVKLPILFKIWVMNYAIESGRWKVIGNKPLDDELLKPVRFFKKDKISKKLYIYLDGVENLASKDECKNLECAAVWDPEHVEDRLKDYYSGIPNKWVESLRI